MSAPVPAAPESPQETPAAVLRRAAAKVRELGEAARARGPYFVEGSCMCEDDEDWTGWCADRTNHRHSSWQVRTEVPHDPTIISYQVVDTNCEDDARWLALMAPTLADPLAAWLEREAVSADRHVEVWRHKRPDGWDGDIGDPWVERPEAEHAALVRNAYGNALSVARALLGEDPS